MRTDGHIYLQTRIKMITQNFGNARLGTQASSGIVGDFSGHDLTITGAVPLVWRNQELVGQAPVVRDHKANATLLLIAPYNAGNTAHEHLNNLALQATATVFARHHDQHFVTVEDKVHLSGAEINIVAFPQWHGKTVAIAMTLNPAMHQVHLVYQTIGALAVRHDLAIAFHGAQAVAQCVDLLLISQAQSLAQLAVTQWLVRLTEHVENDFTTGNRVVVIGSLTRGVRIFDGTFLSGHENGAYRLSVR